MGTSPSPRRTTKVVVLAIGGFLAVCVLAFTGTVALVAYGLSGLHFGWNGSGGRKHLDPIPISQSACPYVKAMHLGAVGFQKAEPGFLGWIDIDPKTNKLVVDPRTWREHKLEIDHAIVVLDVTIRAAAPHLPKRVNDQLLVTRNALHLGRIQLHLSQDENDLARRTSDIEDRGQTAFGNASDLIGNACGVTVGV